MHAYDAVLISGNTLSARYAKVGETLTTLDDKSLTLDETTLIIADTENL
jgi:phenylalanyl-tRNA synthetase beta chain